MTPPTYASPEAFRQALEQRLRSSANSGAELARYSGCSCQRQVDFLGAPSCVSQRCLNVFAFQVWVCGEDLLLSSTGCQHAHDGPHGDAHASDAGAPAHHLGVMGDAVHEILQFVRASNRPRPRLIF